MKEAYLMIAVIVGTAVLIGGGALVADKLDASSAIQPSADAKAAVGERSHSWGDIPISGGNKEASFTIANEGATPLRLFNVSTSCMCTTAQLTVGGKTSPAFGMHDSSRYVTEVPPGEAATLTVVFDPDFHGPQGIGAITRYVKVQTNDATQAELTFTLDGTVS